MFIGDNCNCNRTVQLTHKLFDMSDQSAKYLNVLFSGTGSYVPSRIVPNSEFASREFLVSENEKANGTPQEVVQKFEAITGIRERRYVDDNLVTSDMAAEACARALESAGIDKEEVNLLIVAQNFGDVRHGQGQGDQLPSLASKVKQKLDLKNPSCQAFDIIFGCPGWVQAVIVAEAMMRSGNLKHALVVGAESLSRVVDPSDRDSMIFADGAGATVLTAVWEKEKRGILHHEVLSHGGEDVDFLYMDHAYEHPDDQKYIKMKGRKIYEYALKYVPEAMKTCMDGAGYSLEDLSRIVMHQANEKMEEQIAKRFVRLYGQRDFDKDLVPMTIDSLGNSSVATVPTLLDFLYKGEFDERKVKEGDLYLLASVGAGMNINAVLYKW